MGVLYRLEFADGKAYVGATKGSLKKRFNDHRLASRKSTRGVVYHAWRQFGVPKLKVLAIVENKDLALTEARAIQVFNTVIPNGYNVLTGYERAPSLNNVVSKKIGSSLQGKTLSAETRQKIAKTITGRRHSEAAIQRMKVAQTGKIFSLEAKENMAAAKRGGQLSDEIKQKMSEAQRLRRKAEGCTPQRWRYP